MIETTLQAVTDYTLQRVIVTILTVLAFGLASWGLIHAFATTRSVARNVAANVAQRDLLIKHVQEEYARIHSDPSLTEEQIWDQQQEAEDRALRMEEEFTAASKIPFMLGNVRPGSEPVAESLVRELSEGTRTDLWILGVGLVLGLIASVWGTWIP